MTIGQTVAKGGSSLGSIIGKGIIAGLAGTLAITISQMIEMKITKRKPSSTPADAADKVLDIEPTEDGSKQKLSQQVHWAYGTGWGVMRGLLSAAGINGWAATGLHFAAVEGTAMAMLPGLNLAPPVKKWGAKEIGKEMLHHAVYAIAAGLVFDAISKRRS